jgi:hypothetical protein
VAANARSVRDLGLRDHAPADARRNRDPVLGALDGAISNGEGTRRRAARRRARRVGRSGLLLARAQPARRRARGRDAIRRRAAEPRGGAPRGAGHRAVHSRRDRVDRIRRARAARRWQRRARARAGVRDPARHQVDRRATRAVDARRRIDDRASRRRGTRRSQPGPDGARRDTVLADDACVPRLPARRALRGREDRSLARAAGGGAAQAGIGAAEDRVDRDVDRRPRRDRARQARAVRAVRRAVGAATVRARGRPRDGRCGSHAGGALATDPDPSPAGTHRRTRRDAGDAWQAARSGLRRRLSRPDPDRRYARNRRRDLGHPGEIRR